MTERNPSSRYCVECGTPFEIEGFGRPPIRCPKHRTVRRELRRGYGVCAECGAEFQQKHGKPWLYCEQHRGVLNTRRRMNAKKGIVRRRNSHACNERCHEIEQMIRQVPVPTLQQIGDRFGVSREMARIIISHHGWNKPSSYSGWTCSQCGDKVKTSREEHFKTLAHERALRERREQHARERMNWNLGAFIYALHKAGYKPSEITYLTDSYPLAPYRWLLMLGENPYTHGPHNRLSPQRAAERDRQVALAYAEGVETPTICEMFDLSTSNLHRIVREQRVSRPDWYLKEFTGWNARRRALSDKA